jgi:hypothetical protein
LIWSNSAWVIVPLASNWLAFSISLAGAGAVAAAGHRPDAVVELGLRRLGVARTALGHVPAVGDEVDEHAEVRQHDHEDDPARLDPAGHVVRRNRSMKTVMSSQNQSTQRKRDHDRPERIEKRVVRREHHAVHLLSRTVPLRDRSGGLPREPAGPAYESDLPAPAAELTVLRERLRSSSPTDDPGVGSVALDEAPGHGDGEARAGDRRKGPWR